MEQTDPRHRRQTGCSFEESWHWGDWRGRWHWASSHLFWDLVLSHCSWSLSTGPVIDKMTVSYCTKTEILASCGKTSFSLSSYLIITEEGAGHGLTWLWCGGFTLTRFWFRFRCRCKQILQDEKKMLCTEKNKHTSQTYFSFACVCYL